MITYSFVTEDTYNDEILFHLNEHSRPIIGTPKKEISYFSLEDNEKILGLIRVQLNWDWVIITGLFYNDVAVLKKLIHGVIGRYKDMSYGIHFRTYNKKKKLAFIQLGFDHTGTVKSTNFDDFYYLDLCDYKLDVESNLGLNLREGSQERLDQFLMERNEDIVPSLKEDVSIVALDGEDFAGGLTAKVYDNSYHIELLVVPLEYRGKKIAYQLMKLAEEDARVKGIPMLDLSTAEFQARSFYERLGYEVIYTRENYPKGYQNYKMIKIIK